MYLQSSAWMALGLVDFNCRLEKLINGLKEIHKGYGFGVLNTEGKMLPKFPTLGLRK